uniref:Reverse transcriptase n=1 Tax=Cannabis sativa TaxID=3483 RepID=A0A803P370_CANSA
MAIKLYMSKAYDRVEWSFIENLMLHMGFCRRFVTLVMTCVSTVTYNVVHGGHSMGPILHSRGFVVGDPLSPYLFLICAEGLSALLKNYERLQLLTGCRVARGDPTGEYCNLMRLNEASEDSFYLGLPCIMGRNKNAILGFLTEKMKKKIFSWENKFLSKAGKEVLIKYVAQALPSYAMSVFLLTKEICSSHEGLMAKFWWKAQSNTSHKGISWVSWRRLCQHKHAGGLGFRDLRQYNISFLGKQGWRLLTKEDSLIGRIYKARYYPTGSYITAELGKILALFGIVYGKPNPLFDGLLKDQLETTLLNCLHLQDESYWKKLWKLDVPPKVLHFLWRACSGCLPTKVQLSAKHVNVDLICPLCNVNYETIFHVLLGCRFAQACWHLSAAITAGVDDFSSWFFMVLDGNQGEVAVDTAMISWSIWKTQNEVFWQKKTSNALRVVQSARKALDQWRVATKNTTTSFATGVLSNSNIWSKPTGNKIMVNVDDAIFEAQQRFGFGCVARNPVGHLLEAISDSRIGMVLPEIVEIIGMKEALSWIKRKGWEDVIIETDSLMVVQALNSSVHMSSYFGLLVEDCRLILSTLKNVLISFVYRSANKAAHCLARESCYLSASNGQLIIGVESRYRVVYRLVNSIYVLGITKTDHDNAINVFECIHHQQSANK